jgi:hypothetical protein
MAGTYGTSAHPPLNQILLSSSSMATCLQSTAAYSIKKYVLKLFAIALPVFFAIDMIWLGLVAKDFYRAQIGALRNQRQIGLQPLFLSDLHRWPGLFVITPL